MMNVINLMSLTKWYENSCTTAISRDFYHVDRQSYIRFGNKLKS